MNLLLGLGRAGLNPIFAATAVKVALVVGSVLFMINHGAALVAGEMTMQRWISGVLTYGVPYSVSIHSQFVAQRRQAESL